MKVTVERELKLDAPKGYLLPPLNGEPLERRVFTSTYFDTPDVSLARAGITLRRRVENGVGLWQLKLAAAEGKLELEQPGGPVGPPEELAQLLAAHTRRDELEPVAELRTVRTGMLVNEGSAQVLVDAVSVMDGRRVAETFTEVEIERCQDRGEDCFDGLERTLRRTGAQRGDGRPKLLRVLPPEPATTNDPLHAWFAAQVAAILAHDPGTRLGVDPESLHQMRVGVRRLRALLRASSSLIGDERVLDLRFELKWLGGALGSVRDLDVMLEHLREETVAFEEPEREGAAGVLGALERDRKHARRALLQALSSRRYFDLLDRLEEARGDLPLGSSAKLPALATREFRKLRKAVRAAGDDPDPATLHTLRIRGKRSRYAAELASPVTGRRAKRFVAAAKALQDILGTHQDTIVLEERLRGLLAAGPSPERGLAVGRLIERERRRRDGARAAWPDAWRRLERRGRKAWTT